MLELSDDVFIRDWTLVELGEIVKEHTERVGNRSLDVLSCSKIWGVILQSEKFKHRVASSDISRYKVVHSGMFVFDPMLLWDGSIGRNEYPFPGAVSPAYSVFKLVDGVDASFLTYLLRSSLMTAAYRRISEGTNVRRKKAKFRDFATIAMLLPSLSEQRAIAHVLRTVQEAKEATEAVIAATQDMKKSLMRHLFTYGPVPVDEADQVPLKETEIGPVPEHWEIVRVGDVCSVSTGTTPSTTNSEYYRGNIPFIKTSSIANNVIHSARSHVSETAIYDYRLKVYPRGTVFLAMYGQGKTRGQVALLDLPATTTQNTAAIVPKCNLDSRFLWFYLMSRYGALRGEGIQGHIPHLNLGYVKELPLPLPPLSTQRVISEALNAVQAKIWAEESRSLALERIFTSVLSVLMTGKVRVHDVASALEEVA